MKYVATLHMPLPKMKSFMRLGMSVKGMQNTHSIRSLTARDSRNRFVTVRIRRFRTRTVMMRLFPMKLRRKMSTYSTIRTVWFISDKQTNEMRISYFTRFRKQIMDLLNIYSYRQSCSYKTKLVLARSQIFQHKKPELCADTQER